MGKASSAKKIKRVQQAGVSRAPGQRRNLAFPALIVGIIAAGCILVFFARDHRSSAMGEAPVVNLDYWHDPFGLNICGEFQDALQDAGPNTTGIHTNGDGLIHIQPFVEEAAGPNARFGLFADQVGLTVEDGKITLPDGTIYADGDDCEGEEGRVALYVWPPQATDATDPEIVTEGINDVRFQRNGEIFVLSFNPSDAEIALPPSLENLKNPAQSDPVDTTTSVPEGDAPAEETPAEEAPVEEAPSDEGTTDEPPTGDGPVETTVPPGDGG